MAHRYTDFIPNKETNKQGATSYDDVYSILQDNVDDRVEFYEIEEAVVRQVHLNPEDLSFPRSGAIPDYSFYGSIEATFQYSQNESETIEGPIKPISPHIIVYPVVGEMVNIAKYNGSFYYYNPLNLHNNVNLNRKEDDFKDGTVELNFTKHNRYLQSKSGDVSFNGRFGNGMKFSSNPGPESKYTFPTIKITNGQFPDSRKLKNENFPHVQNINLDASSIILSSGNLTNEIDILIPSAKSSYWPTKWKTAIEGNVIMLNSDSLVFNAKGKDCDAFLMANRNISLAANGTITLEAGENGVINLGEADSINPILKGKQTEDLIDKIFEALSDFSSLVAVADDLPAVQDAAMVLFEKIAVIRTNTLPTIFSKTVFVVEEKD